MPSSQPLIFFFQDVGRRSHRFSIHMEGSTIQTGNAKRRDGIIRSHEYKTQVVCSRLLTGDWSTQRFGCMHER